MAFSLSRLTAYALISSIEEDLRAFINANLGHIKVADLLGDDLLKTATKRAEHDYGILRGDDLSGDILLEFTDFGDLISIINRNKNDVNNIAINFFKSQHEKFEKLIKIRNRVAHSRPLNVDDLPSAVDLSYELLREKSLSFHSLGSALQQLENNPSFVLGITIPDYKKELEIVSHNLPLPDFDETGYLGRATEVNALIKLCMGPYPVISIVGEGGIGKSAIALKVAYEILDSPSSPFEAIIWTSSKTSQLSPTEIVRIEGAIKDSLGMLQDVSTKLTGQNSGEYLDEILDYLKEFKILLILDNLETVLDDRIRKFLSALPVGSKVLITSRIGLGAFDYPYKLDKMNSKDSINLFRSLVKIRRIESLFQVPDKRISEYCLKMKNNPGYIKWFVSAVQAGKRPEEVLRQSNMFLEFCMSNVYEYLSENAKSILQAMLCLTGSYSQAELAYITRFEPLKLQAALHDILRTNMAIMSTKQVDSSVETRYELSPLARDYLVLHHPVESKDHSVFLKRKRQLVAAGEKFDAESRNNPYGPKNIKMRSRRDIVVAKTLRDVMDLADSNDFDEANKLLNDAKSLAPEYFEVYRTNAYLETKKGNLSAALTAYETALELESNSAPLLKEFGEFLLLHLDDIDGALLHFLKAKEIDGEFPLIRLDIARCHLYLGRFEDAFEEIDHVLKKQDLPLWTLKMAYDLHFQIYYRKADRLVENNKHDEALNQLRLLKSEFEKCPNMYIDGRTLKTIQKLQTLTYELNKPDVADHISSRAREIYAWARRICDVGLEGLSPRSIRFGDFVEGVLEVLKIEKGYGFIRYGNGKWQTMFFHRNNLKDYRDWDYLKLEQKVSFRVAKTDDDKLIADQIVLINAFENSALYDSDFI